MSQSPSGSASSKILDKTPETIGQERQGNTHTVPHSRPLIANGTINTLTIPAANHQTNTDPVKKIPPPARLPPPIWPSLPIGMVQPPLNHTNPSNNWTRNHHHSPCRPPNTSNTPNPSPTITSRPKIFKPMDAITLGQSSGSSLPPHQKLALGFSPNYKGDATNLKNRSANIPPSQSTSLYLTNLPNSTTVKSLLDNLTLHGPFGKIWQVYISPGTEANGYSTSAGKIAMFTRTGAEKLFGFIKKGGLVMGGYIVRVAWNRVLVPEQERKGSPYLSRVLIIEGDKEVVNFVNLEGYFRGSIVYQLQDVRILEETEGDSLEEEEEEEKGGEEKETKEGKTGGGEGKKSTRKGTGTRKMEWVFGSYRAQAQTAKMALKRRWPELSVRHGVDPVAVGPGIREGGEKGRL